MHIDAITFNLRHFVKTLNGARVNKGLRRRPRLNWGMKTSYVPLKPVLFHVLGFS